MKSNDLLDKLWKGEVDCNQCGIRDLVLFSHLTSEDFNHIHSPITDHHLGQSESIYAEGEAGAFIYTIRSGLVKLEVMRPSGGPKIVRLLTKGDVTGLEVLVEEHYHHTAVVLEPCDLCKIPVEVVHDLQAHNMTLCRDLMERWGRSVHSADQWLAELNTGQARQRVTQFIDYLVDNSESAPDFILPSRDDMSSILSLTKETVSRIIADLKREGQLTDYGHGVHEANTRVLPK